MNTPFNEDNGELSGKLSIIDRFFLNIERLAYTHSIVVIIASLLTASLSVWFAVEKLSFKNDRGDLVANNLDYVEAYEKYRQEFEDFDGMMVVISGQDPERMKEFSDFLVAKIKLHSQSFSTVFHKVDTEYFREKGLLYLKKSELADLVIKINSHENFLRKINRSPGLNELMESINAEISTGMVSSILTGFLENEYSQRDKDETGDLSFLIALEKQMLLYLQGKESYRSPWISFLTGDKKSLNEEGYLVSANERLMFILLAHNENNKEDRSTLNSINLLRKLIKKTHTGFPEIEVGLTGEDVIAADEMAITQVDVRNASQIALFGVTLLFIIAYRGVIKPLFAVLSLVIALCWSVGWATLVVGHLNILTIVFTTILIGLGIDFGIHILERYKEERMSGSNALNALQKTVQGTGRGNFAGAVTTALAFGGMVFTDFIGIVELGKISSGGIFFCMISMILVLPAFISLEEKIRKPKYAQERFEYRASWLELCFNSHRLVIFVAMFLIVLSLFSLRTVKFDYNLLNLQAHGTEAVKYEMKVIEEAGRSAWSVALLTDSLEETIKKHHALEKLSAVGNVESIVSLLPENQKEKFEYIKELRPFLRDLTVKAEVSQVSQPSLIKTMKKIRFKLQGKEDKGEVAEARKLSQVFLDVSEEQSVEITEKRLNKFSEYLFADYRDKVADLKMNIDVSPVSVAEIPKSLRKRYVSQNGVYLITVYPSVDVWNIDQREEFLRQLRQVDPSATGNAIHMFESTRLMRDGYVQGGLYALVAIFIYILISFGNVRTTLIVLLPVVVGSIWTVGIMGLLGIAFNLANLVILPLIIGVGVVNGIHIVHRYREETDKSINILSKSTGRGVVLSSLTTMIGFGSLMVADYQGIYSLGLILTLGVGCCLLASITVLPCVLKHCTDKGWEL
ncbi:MAG: MMPL family transporter [Nitrospinaceae bacterium]|nr:MMPL family transporter [Nitrospinaceae bacterium]